MSENATDRREYDVVVIGGGPAGLTAGLYTTRLGHATAVVERGGGRAAMMRDVHNLVGVPAETSGNEFLATGREQLESYGCDVVRDFVSSAVETDDGRFRVCGNDADYLADCLVVATGFDDVRPAPPLPRTGRGLHYCLHCDAYMFVDEPVYVMGASESAAHVAAIMLNFTGDVDLLTRGEDPDWSDETAAMLERHPIDVVTPEITGVRNGDDGWLEALEFDDGTIREYRGGFAMYGSNYHNELAAELGCERNDDGTVAVDDHGRTSVDGVFAVGDVTPGHNQVPVALGEGAKAGIAIHWALREFPREVEEPETAETVRDEEVPGIPDELLEQAIATHTYDD
ncbi:NAD(P)/FAD-dependent oxidoreductase [Halopiger goleimassiliensis]|uniref:NAD(P)/FAD-dependent oxidoreductase n=1 Tax=Halopiger goleimassiliensis TaxID=1293048 RepID=UPI0006777F3F|nr:NAD(P)/FAD-dependent oxidoreductase [Halopiger goleimassiliensis]